MKEFLISIGLLLLGIVLILGLTGVILWFVEEPATTEEPSIEESKELEQIKTERELLRRERLLERLDSTFESICLKNKGKFDIERLALRELETELIVPMGSIYQCRVGSKTYYSDGSKGFEYTEYLE